MPTATRRRPAPAAPSAPPLPREAPATPATAGSAGARRVLGGLLAGMAVLLAACDDAPAAETLHFAGPADGALLGEADLAGLRFEATALERRTRMDALAVLLDGQDVTADAEVDDARLVYLPTGLPDGERVVAIAPRADADAPDGTPPPEPLHTWSFRVDATPPPLEVGLPASAIVDGQPLAIAGETEPGAAVAAGEVSGTADEAGRFELVLDTARPGTVEVTATDAAGNVTRTELAVVTVPSRVALDEYRAVHVSFCGWASPTLREPILQMVADGLINAIQLDLKDEAGQIAFDSQVPLARETGAIRASCTFDLAAAVAQLHEVGVPVIGRMVAFADPIMAQWAWEHGHRDWVVQRPEGTMHVGRYAGFTNPASPDIVAYNVDVAVEAAALGVDHILWDYIRRPEGTVGELFFDGLDGDIEDAVVAFTQAADEALAPYRVKHGASVYGIAATRPRQIGQDIPRMAEHLDYVAPMVYPSHWGPGEFGLADPNRAPRAVVRDSLETFQRAVEGTRARVIPWLEDTAYRAWDRPLQVREQILGALDVDIDEWMLWDPRVRYTPSALQARDRDGA